MGKKCSVPYCNTGNRKFKEKHPMYGVPKDDFFLCKWQEAIGRDDRPINSNDAVCQRHFKPDDFIRNRVIKGEVEEYKVPKLKPDAVPSIFPEIPDCIHATVKKRRKLSVDVELYKKSQNNYIQIKCIDSSNNVDNIKEEPKDTNGNTQSETWKECDNKSSQNCNKNGAINFYEVLLKEEIDIKEEEEVKGDLKEELQLLKEEDGKKEEELPEELMTGPKIFHCTLCDYSTKWPHNLQTHQTKHLEGEEHYYKCDDCPKFRTKWITTYKNHMKMKHSTGPVETFKCSYCTFQTKVKLCLKRHSVAHLAAKKRDSDFSSDTSQKNQKNADRANNNDQIVQSSFNCAKCSYQTNSHKLLLNHFVTSSCYIYKEPKINPKFNCKECKFECSIKADFLKHTLFHRNITVEKVKRTSVR